MDFGSYNPSFRFDDENYGVICIPSFQKEKTMSEDPDAPAEIDERALLQELIQQNKQMLEELKHERQENAELRSKIGARKDGSLAGGFQYADGQVHFNDPKLSDEQLWSKMEDQGGVLG